jgi:Flp pilus assembly pilin Flp
MKSIQWHSAERGAALIDYALLMSFSVMLAISGMSVGSQVSDRFSFIAMKLTPSGGTDELISCPPGGCLPPPPAGPDNHAVTPGR